MAAQAHKVAAMMMRVLNVTSMLSAYQAEHFDDMTEVPDTSMQDEITTVADIILRVQRSMSRLWGTVWQC